MPLQTMSGGVDGPLPNALSYIYPSDQHNPLHRRLFSFVLFITLHPQVPGIRKACVR